MGRGSCPVALPSSLPAPHPELFLLNYPFVTHFSPPLFPPTPHAADHKTMGNAESQNVEHEFYGEKHASLGRKHTSRSLRLSHKARRTRHASSGKVIHRNSEVSTRSSSTPSIPQSLAENGLEPFSQEGTLEDFGSPIWVDRVDMGLRPVSYTDSSVTPSVDSSIVLTAASVQSMPDSEETRLYGDDTTYLADGGRRQHPYTSNGPTFMETASFKKKRSKSADIWREDSLEFSLSDLSQEHLTSNEEILGSTEEKDCEEARGMEPRASPRQLSSCQRANSLGDLYAQKNSGVTANGGPRSKFAGYCRNLVSDIPDLANHKMPPAAAEESLPYSNYNTLPCRKSHCLSEGATNPQISHSNSMQGRRAKTTQVKWLKSVSLFWKWCMSSSACFCSCKLPIFECLAAAAPATTPSPPGFISALLRPSSSSVPGVG